MLFCVLLSFHRYQKRTAAVAVVVVVVAAVVAAVAVVVVVVAVAVACVTVQLRRASHYTNLSSKKVTKWHLL